MSDPLTNEFLEEAARKLWSSDSLSFSGTNTADKPIAKLMQRLEAADGYAWLDQAFTHPLFATLGDPRAALLDKDAVPVAALIALRDHAKKLHQTEAAHPDAKLVGVLAYFLATAAIRVHHGKVAGKRPWSDYRAALDELLVVLPPPWDEFVLRAVEAGE